MNRENKLIEEFQCPGCVSGHNTKCGSFKLDKPMPGAFRCGAHVPGTMMFPGGAVAIGLPRGFNKVGVGKMSIRFYDKGAPPIYDNLNVPVWAMEVDGYLFVRVYSPRINATYVDVIEGATIAEFCPNAIDVGKFVDEID